MTGDEITWSHLRACRPTAWLNPRRRAAPVALEGLPLTAADLESARDRWRRWQPLIQRLFPREAPDGIRSPLRSVPRFQAAFEARHGLRLDAPWLLKCDSDLPIAGSIKARGGFYEVLHHAESVAVASGLMAPGGDGLALAQPLARTLFQTRHIAVGSTGNLGLSIGIMGAALGFRVTVYMSREAKAWKKDLLRARGATVLEVDGDFNEAVARARAESAARDATHFIDDEQSPDLFLGYAVAAYELESQLAAVRELPDGPLRVDIPCGVGGAAGGIAFGLAHRFGDRARCWTAEPTHTPCVLLGLLSGRFERANVRDYGIDGRTAADGLAVAAPSRLATPVLDRLIEGAYTVDDDELFDTLALLYDTEGIRIEPSAAASLLWPLRVPERCRQTGGAHIAWTTGGLLLPDGVYAEMRRHAAVRSPARASPA